MLLWCTLSRKYLLNFKERTSLGSQRSYTSVMAVLDNTKTRKIYKIYANIVKNLVSKQNGILFQLFMIRLQRCYRRYRKRVANRASLQRPKENQILTPLQMFEFCSTTASLSTIHCFYKTHQQLELDRESFKTRLVSICQYTEYYKY